ncbi:hypothetical protein [Butyrivibrio sp. VCB2006]|uniref:hypothetical protein n=1 Tax=Butyrivibrio sp. VCB2006 TaxID=1280679 RepID=UPI0003F543AB|nr:hypothetical protein [Butyrivibrio sp. VCB2006]
MYKSNRVLGVLAAAIMMAGLSGVIFSIVDQKRPADIVAAQKENKDSDNTGISDERGELTAQKLFSQSDETLQYAGSVNISGKVTAHKMHMGGFDTKYADITYSRKYVDRDNYMGELSVDASCMPVGNVGSKFWRCIYVCNDGRIDGKDYSKLNVDGDFGQDKITKPSLESILFPDINNCDYSMEKVSRDNGIMPDIQTIDVTLSGDISNISIALESLIGKTVKPTTAVYRFDEATHVLKEIYISSDVTSLMTKDGENAPLLEMTLNVEDYQLVSQDGIALPISGFYENELEEFVDNKKLVELNIDMVMAGRTWTLDNNLSHWNQNVDDMWLEIYNYSRAYTMQDLLDRAKEVGAKYEYDHVSLSYGYSDVIEGNRHLLIRLDFTKSRNDYGTIIIPVSVDYGKLVSGISLATLGRDSYFMNGDKLLICKKTSDMSDCKVLCRFLGSKGFELDMYEICEHSLPDLGNNRERDHFCAMDGEKLGLLASEYSNADNVELRHITFAGGSNDRFNSVEGFYVARYNNKALSEIDYQDEECVIDLDKYGLEYKSQQYLKGLYEEKGIIDGAIENTVTWTIYTGK